MKQRSAEVELRERIASALVDLVAEREPIERKDLLHLLLEQIPEATKNQVEQAITHLSRKHRLERWADGYHTPGLTKTGAITKVERDAVTCLGSGRTALEVADAVEGIRDATSARLILEGLVRRNVLRRRAGGLYEAAEPAI
jgi:hypothetical protein